MWYIPGSHRWGLLGKTGLAGDMDADGDADIFITHLKGESNTLYVNNGSGIFFDGTLTAGLAAPSIPATRPSEAEPRATVRNV